MTSLSRCKFDCWFSLDHIYTMRICSANLHSPVTITQNVSSRHSNYLNFWFVDRFATRIRSSTVGNDRSMLRIELRRCQLLFELSKRAWDLHLRVWSKYLWYSQTQEFALFLFPNYDYSTSIAIPAMPMIWSNSTASVSKNAMLLT